MGVGHASYTIGNSGPCCQEGHTWLARTFGPSFSRVYGCLLVAGIDHTNALPRAAIINSSNMSAAQGEDNFNPFAFQNSCNGHAAVNHSQSELPSLLVESDKRR